jgi:hypothetical protein
MMPNNRKRRQFNLSSLIGWLIFILVIAGGPLISLLRRAFSGVVALPPNLTSWLPIAIGALVVLSVVVSALRALNNANRGVNTPARLPTELSRPTRPSAAMPPFGGQERSSQPPPVPSPGPFSTPSNPPRSSQPRFDPLFNPAILAIGLAGLLVLGALALFVLGQGGP